LVNNNGGGIFQRLPVARLEPLFEELFLAPHNLDFSPIAATYGLEYHVAPDLAPFKSIFDKALITKAASIIEVQTDSHEDDRIRRQINSLVKSQVNAGSAGKKK